MALRLSTGLQNALAGINTEMVTNGGFASATTSWVAATSTLASVASGQSGNCLEITETGGAAPGYATQAITTKVGHQYILSLYFKKGTSDSGKFTITDSDGTIYDSGALTDAAWARKFCIFTARQTSTTISLQTTDATIGETSLFDTVTMKEYSHSLQDCFSGGEFRIYSGTQPADPDDVATTAGTLLVTIKNGVNGITFGEASDGTIAKSVGETWSGVVATSGTAGWFRLVAPGDLGTDNTTDFRIDGSIATSGGQINFTSLAFEVGSTQTISDFQPSVNMSN